MPEFICKLITELPGFSKEVIEEVIEEDSHERAADRFLRDVHRRYTLCNCCSWGVSVRDLESSVPVELWGRMVTAFDMSAEPRPRSG